MSQLPVPSSTWEIGPGGTVELVGAPKRAPRGRALTKKPRAASACGACGQLGHNARNKRCPAWDPNAARG